MWLLNDKINDNSYSQKCVDFSNFHEKNWIFKIWKSSATIFNTFMQLFYAILVIGDF